MGSTRPQRGDTPGSCRPPMRTVANAGSSSCIPSRRRWRRAGGLPVGKGSRNRQFHIRSRSGPAEYRELAPYHLGALLHAGETEVSLAPHAIQHVLVDALAVVPHPETKVPLVVPHFHVDVARL